MKKHPSGGVSAVVTLFLITAVMAGLLAMVNAVTAGPIADGLREKTEKALSGVLAEGVVLEEELENFPDETGLVEAVYRTSSGYVVEAVPSGYGGEIHMAVGVDGAGQVTGVKSSAIPRRPVWVQTPQRTAPPGRASGTSSWEQPDNWRSPRTAEP